MPLTHGAEASRSRQKFERFLRVTGLMLACVGGCAAPAAEPPRLDDAIVVILPQEPEQLDPRYVGDAYGLKLSRLIHASLVRIDPISLEPVADLAERIDLEGSTRYRVTLREGLRFSDGSALDADDVVATFRGLVDPRVRARYATTYRRIRSVHAPSRREVVFELAAPHATFITDLEIPILRAEDALEPASNQRLPLGAGPYRFASRAPGNLELVENPHYFAGPIAVSKLRFVIIHDDNTRAMRMLAGAGDLALNTVPPLLVPLFEGPGFEVRSAPGVGTKYLGINLEQPVLRDVRVRQAIAHAIDRGAIVRHKLGGRARLASGWVVPGHWAHASDTPSYAYDPARARALLDAAGHAPGPDGVRLSLTMRTSSDRFVVSTARAMASMLADVGIDLDVRPSENATLLADLGRGRFELAYLQIPEVFEPHVLSWFFASDRVPIPGKQEGSNRWRMRNAELDALLEQGRSLLDRPQRAEIYRKVQHLLARELPVIPLWHDDVVAVTSPRLSDYRVPRDGRFGTLALPLTRVPQLQ